MKNLILIQSYLNKYSKSSLSPAVTESGIAGFPFLLSYTAGILGKDGDL
jgi:hypothetical protein